MEHSNCIHSIGCLRQNAAAYSFTSQILADEISGQLQTACSPFYPIQYNIIHTLARRAITKTDDTTYLHGIHCTYPLRNYKQHVLHLC